jgi:hypothetical protein
MISETKTPYFSHLKGEMPKGCQYCVKGEKLVLYSTGLCPRQCWYCPLSENRKDLDVTYANEWKTNNIDDIIKEAELTNAKGAGITGGDPLAKIDRTCLFIQKLKEHFGKEFHIHLYTSFVLATKNNLERLYHAGLDEIRFHPDFNKESDWKNINNALEFEWDIGIEIPCIKENKKQILKICDYFENKIKFLNLNELEIAENNMDEMDNRNYISKTDISHAVKGSEKLGKEIINYCKNKKFSIHFCTSKLKDNVQMVNRFKKRAENIANKYDIIIEGGLLQKGVIYLKDNIPGINFDKKIINSKTQNELLKKLEKTLQNLKIEGLDAIINNKKYRIETYPEHVLQYKEELKKLDLVPVIIEEDPTVKAFELNRDFL